MQPYTYKKIRDNIWQIADDDGVYCTLVRGSGLAVFIAAHMRMPRSRNREIVNMSFSRYDQMFLGFITDTSRRVTESVLERLAGEVVEIRVDV